MSYDNMSDEDKIIKAVEFVARGVTIPYQLRRFLEDNGLYELVTNPTEVDTLHDDSERHCG